LLKNVSVQYGDKTILQNINWQVQRGDKWWIQGPNGAGKSTLLSLLTGDNPQAYANEIYLFDKRRGSGESIWDIKKKIGYISPELHWFFDKGITVYGAIASGFFDTMGLYRRLSVEQESIVAKWITYFDLNTLQHKSLSLLPSGLQRLVLLARALVKNPPMLILDEPCQGLDDNQTATFVNLIDQLVVRNNRTLLYVTHYEHEVPNCIDKKLVLNKGIATFSNIIKRKSEAA
jgi:molybdate transport system ATP-binding protein